jgi:hypothetical protein
MVETEEKTDKLEKIKVETEDKTYKLENIKAKRRRLSSSEIDSDTQKYKRIQRCRAKPSYLLCIGPKSSRSEYLNRLPGLLRELLRNRHWNDASRVLSVLMKGTINDPCPKMNRLKYEVCFYLSKIETVFVALCFLLCSFLFGRLIYKL